MTIPAEIALFITLGVLTVFMWYLARKGEKTLLNRFTGKFPIIGSIFIPIGIFLTYRVFSLQLQAMTRDATYKIIDRGWLDINKKIVDYYDNCPNFMNSLYFDWQKKVLGKETNSMRQDDWYVVNYMSILIFQAWEDFITSATVDETGHTVWINNFLQWANSEILYNNWEVLKTNFADTTQAFGDYLFYMVKSRPPKNEYEMNELAKDIAESEKFKNILNKRFNVI